MANTEGLDDDTVASLLANDSWRDSKMQVQDRRRKALERRMEMPVGERPAARVVKKSSSTRSKSKSSGSKGTPVTPRDPAAKRPSPPRSINHEEQKEEKPPLVLGSIMERPVGRRQRNRKPDATAQPSSSSDVPTDKTSRFARRRQLQPPVPGGGFLSVNVPVGTFVNKTSAKAAPSRATNINNGVTPTPRGGSNKASVPLDTSLESTLQACSEQAEAMLAGMSRLEIEEKQQELRSALSPETIAFLQKRAEKKSTPQSDGAVASDATNSKQQFRGGTTKSTSSSTNGATELEEKERMANLLSSVRTYEDLDAAYAAEMGEEQDAEDNVTSTEDKFVLACDLLRSSSPRQTLWAARIVSERLRDDILQGRRCSLGGERQVKWPYPILLPVSLRCLLDAPHVRVNGFVLHAYVLQSLYMLLRLRACVDHDVDVTGFTDSPQTMFQTIFMDDAVPTPPPDRCYKSSKVESLSFGKTNDAAYATSSSSTSAQTDGESFAKDPMWTLLAQMRILPRLAELVSGKRAATKLLPQEALVAMVGILALLGQRSPGAASAIVQHPTLLANLTELTVVPPEGAAKCDPAVALPTMMLLCCLARQSRVAANGLDVTPLLGQILATKPTCEMDFRLQRWTLILWRTLLRYGLGVDGVETVLTVAAPQQLALGFRGPFSLSADITACLADAARCISSSSEKAGNGNAPAGGWAADDHTTLSRANAWLSSSVRQVQSHLDSASVFLETSTRGDQVRELQSYSASLKLLSALVDLESFVSDSEGEFKTEGMTSWEEERCITSATKLVDNGVVGWAAEMTLRDAFTPNGSLGQGSSTIELGVEAASASFLEAFCGLVATLHNRYSPDLGANSLQNQTASLVDNVQALFSSVLDEEASMTTSMQGSPLNIRGKTVPRPQSVWTNRAHVSVFHLLQLNGASLYKTTQLAFMSSILGRLDIGEESIAAALASWLCNSGPTLSNLLLRELSRTPSAKTQLVHSAEIHCNLCTNPGVGDPFELQSLRSQADVLGVKKSDHMLPVDGYWLWNIFASSGAPPPSTGNSEQLHGDTTAVLITSLSLISQLEKSDDEGICRYAGLLNPGAKQYFLLNLCLQTESILCNDGITSTADSLLSKYSGLVDRKFVSGFAQACMVHSLNSALDSAAESADLSESEKKIVALFNNDNSQDSCVPAKGIRCMEDLINDLTAAYADYGAQYNFFTGCLRLLLFPAFPTKIRCEVLKQTKGLLHLFTLESGEDLAACIEGYLSIPNEPVKQENYQAPEFLDTIASVFSKETRPDSGFVGSLALALLARDLSSSILSDSKSAVPSRRRLELMQLDMALRTVQVSAAFLASKRTTKDLAHAAVWVEEKAPIMDVNTMDEATWGRILDHLGNAQ